MSKNIRLVVRELWELMTRDDCETVNRLRKVSKQGNRLGICEDCLRAAIKESSIGFFSGKICYFSGRVYENMSVDEFENMIIDLLFDYVKLPKIDYCAVYQMQRRCLILAKSKHLEIANNYMVFRNGVLDTETGVFYKKFDKRFVQMWAVDYDYNPEARTFLWYQFLNQVLPDQKWQDILQMFLGATFINRSQAKIENILILLGAGANGKSVINSAVLGVLGEYVGTKSIGSLCSRGIDGEESVALINGKRLNYCTEMSVDDFKRKSARLKTIVSGERTSARFRYEKGFDATNIPLLMANANKIPYFNTDDEALLRRIYPIPFEVVIPEEKRNPNLGYELVSEYPAILNWILEGRDKFIKNGYKLPPEEYLEKLIDKGVTEYDSVLKFMKKKGWKPKLDGVDIPAKDHVKASNIYNEYNTWCLNNGLKPVSNRSFNSLLEKSGYTKRRFSDGIGFYVFGDITFSRLQREARAYKEKEAKYVLSCVDGVDYATSRPALAYFTGVSEHRLQRRMSEGKLREATKAFKERRYYDVNKSIEILRDLRDISTDEEKDIARRIHKSLKYMRNIFNQRMEYHNLPYRKYALEEEQVDGCITIPDEMTDDEVFRMAVKDLGFDMRHVRSGSGAFGRGGKGAFDSIEEIPTKAEKRKYNKHNK